MGTARIARCASCASLVRSVVSHSATGARRLVYMHTLMRGGEECSVRAQRETTGRYAVCAVAAAHAASA